MMDDLTFIIKTFERPQCVRRLVKSIYKKYPDAIVLIGDDSKISCKAELEKRYKDKNLKVFELPFDCGVSYGRNYLLDKIETDYFCILDDDFVFDKDVDINAGLEVLKEKNIDILGGYLRNYRTVKNVADRLKIAVDTFRKNYKKINYIGNIEYDDINSVLTFRLYPSSFPDFDIYDIVFQFFVAKTNIREKIKWDEELKTAEHEAFFLQAKSKSVKVGFSNKLSVRHKPIRSKKYGQFRDRNFYKIFMTKNNIKQMIFYRDGVVSSEVKI